MQIKYALLHGAFQSPTSWKVPHGFSEHVICLDCSTLSRFQTDTEAVLSGIEKSPTHLIVVATSLGCIHGIELANRAANQNTVRITLVLCAVPSMVVYQWQTQTLCSVLNRLDFLRNLPLPKWLARKVWTTASHQENISLLSALPPNQQQISEHVETHVIYTLFDFLAGTKYRQARWVHLRSKSTPKTNLTLLTHYPYIFDRQRFWSYLRRLSLNDV